MATVTGEGSAHRTRLFACGSGMPAAVVDMLGVSLLITWSFVFWNGPLLGGAVGSGASFDGLLLAQGVATALAAFACVVASGLLARPVNRRRAQGAVAACACVASVLGGVAALRALPLCAFAAFALSGVGSALFLGWQERLGRRGVSAAAGRMGVAYAMSLGSFLALSALPAAALTAATALLPVVSCALLVRDGERSPGPDTVTGLADRLGAIPWRLPVAIAIAYFCFGIARGGGVVVDTLTFDAGDMLRASVPIACCLMGVMLAYVAYRCGAMAGLYVAFPALALGCLLNIESVTWGDVVAFGLVNVGSELVRHLTWFLMIDVIVKDGASALLCLAVLRVAHWGGCTLGQVAAGVLGLGSVLSGVAVVLLMAGIFAILGVDTLFRGRSLDRAAEVHAMGTPASGESGGMRQVPDSRRATGVGVAEPLGTGHAHGRSAGSRAAGKRGAPRDGGTPGVPGSLPRGPGAGVGTPDEGASLTLPQERVTQVAERFGLSPRETEVLAIWVTGRALSYVEKALFISRSTVKTHLNHIYAKTGTANREELIELVAGEVDSVPLG